MQVYYFLLLIILLAAPLCMARPSRAKKAAYVALVFGCMLFLSAFRYNIGTDYQSYREIYARSAALPWSRVFADDIEAGFHLMNKLFYAMGCSYEVYIGLTSLLCLLPVAVFILRYSRNVWLSCFLYATTGGFYATMGFMRQSLAIGVLLWGYGLLRQATRRTRLQYALLVLLASLIHRSALVMLPALLLLRLPWRRNTMLWYGFVGGLIVAFSPQLLDRGVTILSRLGPGLAKLAGYRFTYYFYGLQPLQLIFPAVLLIFVLLLCRFAREEPDMPLLRYMTVFHMFFWLFVLRHFLFVRFSLYFLPYSLLCVPMLVESLRPTPPELAQCALLRERADAGESALYEAAAEKVALKRTAYVWCLVGVLLFAFAYDLFNMYYGVYVDGHGGVCGVFPYESLLPFLNALP